MPTSNWDSRITFARSFIPASPPSTAGTNSKDQEALATNFDQGCCRVWDSTFGTYYRPKAAAGEFVHHDPNAPRLFLGQLWEPLPGVRAA